MRQPGGYKDLAGKTLSRVALSVAGMQMVNLNVLVIAFMGRRKNTVGSIADGVLLGGDWQKKAGFVSGRRGEKCLVWSSSARSRLRLQSNALRCVTASMPEVARPGPAKTRWRVA
jgi:hypothetical protein